MRIPMVKPKLVPPQLLKSFSGTEYWTELKYNGDRCLVVIDKKNSTVRYFTRYGHEFKRFDSPDWMSKELLRRCPKNFLILDGELLHFKVPSIKNTLVLYDIASYENSLPFYVRRMLLELWFPFTEKDLPCSDEIVLAKRWNKNFSRVFEEHRKDFPLIEGIVLKKRLSMDTSYKVRYPKEGVYAY